MVRVNVHTKEKVRIDRGAVLLISEHHRTTSVCIRCLPTSVQDCTQIAEIQLFSHLSAIFLAIKRSPRKLMLNITQAKSVLAKFRLQ
jgi:hypothetical protein